MKMRLISVLLWIIAVCNAQEESLRAKQHVKRSYVCPPNFIRISHRCYFFSKEMATWQDAFFKCRELHSYLAVIKNANQDKLIRRTLSKSSLVPLERWLGGLYDWEQMAWKWAASGKPLGYQGFSQMQPDDKEKMRWHCIIVDPSLQYKWNMRSCLEEKHYICHTKIKIVNSKDKKKLLKQYNVKKLNEIPVPIIPEDHVNNTQNYKEYQADQFTYKVLTDNQTPGNLHQKRKTKRNRKDRTKNFRGGDPLNKKRKNRNQEKPKEKFRWKTYFSNVTISPLHPKAIVEEYNLVH